MAMSAEHRSKFEYPHRPWWRHHMSEKIIEWDDKLQNKLKNKRV